MTERNTLKTVADRNSLYPKSRAVYNENLDDTTMRLYRDVSPIQFDNRTEIWVGLKSKIRLKRVVRAKLIHELECELRRLGLSDQGWREYYDSFEVKTKRLKEDSAEEAPTRRIFIYRCTLTSTNVTENLHETLQQYARSLSEVPGVLGGDVYIRAF